MYVVCCVCCISSDSSRWDKGVYITLCFGMCSGSKGDYHKRNKCPLRTRYLYNIAKKACSHFLLAIFIVLLIVKKNKRFLWKNIDSKIWTFWPDLDLIYKSHDGKVTGSNEYHYRYLRAKWPREHVLRGVHAAFIFSNLLWPDLDLFKYYLGTRAVPFLDI